MKLTAEMIQKAKDAAEDAGYDYMRFGIRVQEEEFRLGTIDHKSHVWVDGEDTEEELDGISAMDINHISNIQYFGSHVALIGCNEYESGEDAGEIIMKDASVIAIIA